MLPYRQSGRWQEVLDTCTWRTWYCISSSLVDGRMCLILVLDILDTEYQAVWSMAGCTWYMYLTYLMLKSSSLVYGRMCLILVLDVLDTEYEPVWSMARWVWYLYLTYLILNMKQSGRWHDVLDIQYQVHQVQVPSKSCHRPDCLIFSIKYVKYKYQTHLAIDQTASYSVSSTSSTSIKHILP